MTDNTYYPLVPEEFNDWWDSDELSEGNPFNGDSALFWAFEGWKACEAAQSKHFMTHKGVALPQAK